MIKLPPMRPISFSKTTQAIIERRKTVTRRWGWEHVKVGDCLRGIDKLRMNLRQPPSVTLCCVEVVRVDRFGRIPGLEFADRRRHAEFVGVHSIHRFIDRCTRAGDEYISELIAEGCGHLTASQFIDLLVSMAPKQPRVLTRIEFKYREDLFEAWKASKESKAA